MPEHSAVLFTLTLRKDGNKAPDSCTIPRLSKSANSSSGQRGTGPVERNFGTVGTIRNRRKAS